MSMRSPRLPKSRWNRPVKRSPDATPRTARNWMKELGPLDTGAIGDLNWAYRYHPNAEATYCAAWLSRERADNFAAFFDRTLAVEDLEGNVTLPPDLQPKNLATNDMAKFYLPSLKDALNLTFARPKHAVIVEEDWNVFDILFVDETHWWRLLWATAA